MTPIALTAPAAGPGTPAAGRAEPPLAAVATPRKPRLLVPFHRNK